MNPVIDYTTPTVCIHSRLPFSSKDYQVFEAKISCFTRDYPVTSLKHSKIITRLLTGY